MDLGIAILSGLINVSMFRVSAFVNVAPWTSWLKAVSPRLVQGTSQSRCAMQGLKRRHAEQNAEVRRLSKDLQRMKRRAREHVGPMKIREPQRTIARVLVCINNGEPTAAAEYVSRSSKTRCLDACTKGQLEADLRNWWRGTDVHTRQTYLVVDETKPEMHKAIVQARRFAVDCNLEEWVNIQNVQKGINPGPGIVMQQANVVKTRIGVEPTANRRSSRRWVQRWRGRRGIQLRRGQVRERLSVEQMHGKAPENRAGGAPKSSRGVGCFWVGEVRG